MNTLQLWWNGNTLPTKEEPQKYLSLTAPSFHRWFLSCPTYIGINKGPLHKEFAFVLLGFGIVYNTNWD